MPTFTRLHQQNTPQILNEALLDHYQSTLAIWLFNFTCHDVTHSVLVRWQSSSHTWSPRAHITFHLMEWYLKGQEVRIISSGVHTCQ